MLKNFKKLAALLVAGVMMVAAPMTAMAEYYWEYDWLYNWDQAGYGNNTRDSSSAFASVNQDYYGNYWSSYRYATPDELIANKDAAAKFTTGQPVEMYGFVYAQEDLGTTQRVWLITNYNGFDDPAWYTSNEPAQYICFEIDKSTFTDEFPSDIEDGDTIQIRGLFFGATIDEDSEIAMPYVACTKATKRNPGVNGDLNVIDGNAGLLEERERYDRVSGNAW